MGGWTVSSIYTCDPRREMSRELFTIVRRNARKGRVSYRVGTCYISGSVTPCNARGEIISGRAALLAHVASCRLEGRYKAARDILALVKGAAQ